MCLINLNDKGVSEKKAVLLAKAFKDSITSISIVFEQED